MTGLCTAGVGPDTLHIYHGQGPLVLLAGQPLSTATQEGWLTNIAAESGRFDWLKRLVAR